MKDKFVYIFKKVDKTFLIKITPFILISYFLLLLMPYVFAPIPFLYSFFLKQYVNLTIRFFATLLLFAFSTFIFLNFKPKVDSKYVIFSLVLLFILILSLIISPKTYCSIITHEPYAYETLVVYEIGLLDLISGYISCTIDLAFGLIFVFILPCVCTKQNLKIFLIFVFSFIIFECLFSLVFEFNKYIATLSAGDSDYGGYEIDISGTFVSKNQFGSFLVIGFLSGFVISRWYCLNSRILKITVYVFLILVGAVIVFSLCKTAIISLLLFFAPYLVHRIILLIKRKKTFHIIILLSTISLGLVFVLLVMVTPIGDIGVFNKIQKIIKTLFVDSFSTAKESRYIAWLSSMSTLLNYHIVIGYPKGSLQYVLRIGTNGYAIYPHNGFIQQTLCYGLFGLFVLFYLYCFIFKRIKYLDNKKEKTLWISLLLSAFIFMMTETEVIVMSASLLTFGYNVLLSSIPMLGKTNVKVYHYEIQI